MNGVLTKYEKQELGNVLAVHGLLPEDFIYMETLKTENKFATVTLTNRASSDFFTIYSEPSYYKVIASIPGVSRSTETGGLNWMGVKDSLGDWTVRVKREIEAVDPWEQVAEDMAEDDSYFTIPELPRVDRAIEESLEQLKNLAIEHGVALEQVESEVRIARTILEKSARSSTKKEWIGLFKSIIVSKLVDWGMKTAVFQTILHTLIVSAQDIAQLAEHASRHLH